MVLERLLWHVTCLNHASLYLLTPKRQCVQKSVRKTLQAAYLSLRINHMLQVCSQESVRKTLQGAYTDLGVKQSERPFSVPILV